MLDVFGSVSGLMKFDSSVNIDNFIFRLHYKATVILLITFSLLVALHQYIGDPINCIQNGVPQKVMDTYCWVYSTFTIPDRLGTEVISHDVPYPGIREERKGDTVKYHKYYQWVCCVLFFQALIFYIPRYLWKKWEAGKMACLVHDLNCPIIPEDTKNERKKLLVDYLETNLHKHKFYAIRFFICELLNNINLVGQMYFVDYFLDGEFTTYGIDVIRTIQMEPGKRVDPMSIVYMCSPK